MSTSNSEAPDWFLCLQESKGWRVSYSQDLKKSLVVNTSGSSNTSVFQIHPVEGDGYKNVYCTVMSPTTCKNVGILTDLSGVRRLALTNDEALFVKFKKAHDVEAKSKLKMFPGN